MSDAVMIQIVQVIGVAVASYAAYMTVKLNNRSKETAVDVQQVKVALAENSQTTAATLTLVNGRMGKVLEELAAVRRDLANTTGKSAHIDAAVQAEKEAAHHQALEKTVEAQSGDKVEKHGEGGPEVQANGQT